MENQSATPGLEDLQEVAGYLGLEDGDDQFGDMGYDDRSRRWARMPPSRASDIPIYNSSDKIKKVEVDLDLLKGATHHEFQLIANFLCRYEQMLCEEEKDGVISTAAAAAAADYYYSDDDSDSDYDYDYDPAAAAAADTKFLRQVWEDKGYGVDCYPTSFDSCFTPIPSPNQSNMLKQDMTFIMSALNDDSWEKYKKTYTFVELEDAVWTRRASYYLTFTVKQDGEVEVVERFRAILSILPPPTRLLEYKRLLPDGSWELNIVTQLDDL